MQQKKSEHSQKNIHPSNSIDYRNTRYHRTVVSIYQCFNFTKERNSFQAPKDSCYRL